MKKVLARKCIQIRYPNSNPRLDGPTGITSIVHCFTLCHKAKKKKNLNHVI